MKIIMKNQLFQVQKNTFKVTLYNVNYKENNNVKLPSSLSQEEKIE